jgi:aspartyl-tRNA(Asn)/glutamyl-tRNA(Gln) amidotransferase subunit A
MKSDVENLKSSVWEPILVIAEKVNSGEETALSQVKKSLQRIADLNPKYQAIISVLEENAIKRATEIDAKIKSGEKAGRLAGVPFIAKDNFLVFGADTTAGSNILKGFEAPYQATAVNKLEMEGAICVAKSNLDAFAHGGSTENSDFFVTKNPHDTTRVPGGSSGGSAAGIALQMAPFALGTDTGGSIRQPASYCGVIGYKPTYGLVSRSGVVAMASSTDTIGVFAQSSEDTALVMDCMAGIDVLDGTTIEKPNSSLTNFDLSIKGLRIGVIKEYFEEGIDPKVAEVVKTAVDELKKLGAEVVEISLPSLPLALAVYYIVVPAELSSNLARHDGQRFQYSYSDAKNLDESYEQTRSRGFGAEAKRRIMIGAHVLSSGYYDAYYKKAQTVRTKIIQEFEKAFKSVDFLVGPVAPSTAFKIGENDNDPVKMYLQDIMTVASNLSGVPAISVPCGNVDGLPVGLQLIAPQKHDRELLALSSIFEGAKK